MSPRGFLDLRFHRFKVEARALLHRRELNRGLGKFRDLLLHEDEPPELKGPPIASKERLGKARTLIRIQPEVDDERKVDLDRVAEPPCRLIGKPVFVIANTRGSERAFGEVPDLVALRRALAGDKVRLVV